MQGVAVGLGKLLINSDESLSDASESREQATAISRWERSHPERGEKESKGEGNGKQRKGA